MINLDYDTMMVVFSAGGLVLFLVLMIFIKFVRPWWKGRRVVLTTSDTSGGLMHVHIRCPECEGRFWHLIRNHIAECPECREVFEWRKTKIPTANPADCIQLPKPAKRTTHEKCNAVFQEGDYQERKRKARNARKGKKR